MSRREREQGEDEAVFPQDGRTRPKLADSTVNDDDPLIQEMSEYDWRDDLFVAQMLADANGDSGAPHASPDAADMFDDDGGVQPMDQSDEPGLLRRSGRAFAQARDTTNSTNRRGFFYQGCLDEACKRVAKEHEGIIQLLANELILQRDISLHCARGLLFATLVFIELLKIFLKFNEKGRITFFCETRNKRLSLISKFFYMVYKPFFPVNTEGVPDELKQTFFIAASLAKSKYDAGEFGWEEISGKPVVTLPPGLLEAFGNTFLKRLHANDEKVADRQGDKVLIVVTEAILREPDFGEAQEAVLARFPHYCKSYVRFLLEEKVACFPALKERAAKSRDDDDSKQGVATASQGEDQDDQEDQDVQDDQEDQDDQDDKDAKDRRKDDSDGDYEENIFDRDVTVQKPSKGHEIPATAFAEMQPYRFIADRVVDNIVSQIRGAFPPVTVKKASITLPALTSSDRRKVLWCLCNNYSALEVQGQRQLGVSFFARGFVQEIQHIAGRVYVGGDAAALHAGAAGFRFVINCADEIPCYYEGTGVQYLHVRLKEAQDFLTGSFQAEVSKFLQGAGNANVLIHCREGRCRSVLVSFFALVVCEKMAAQDALLHVYSAAPYCITPRELFGAFLENQVQLDPDRLREHAFDFLVRRHMGELSFLRTTGSVRIKHSDDMLLDAAYLTPVHAFGSGGAHYGFIDCLVATGLKNGVRPVVTMFADHLAFYLSQAFPDDILLLVPFPGHDPSKRSCTTLLVEALCSRSEKFLNGTIILSRTRASPQRSQGGSRDIGEQFKTLEVHTCLSDLLDATHANRIVCIDDTINTGSSFSVFGTLLTRAGVTVPLSGLAVGRFRQPTMDFADSPYFFTSTACASAALVSDVPECCIDAKDADWCPRLSWSLIADGSVGVSPGPEPGVMTLRFATPELACDFASFCPSIPHFRIEHVGFPVEVVKQGASLLVFRRLSAKDMFYEQMFPNQVVTFSAAAWAKLSAEQRAHVQRMQNSWEELSDNDKVQRQELAAREISRNEVVAALRLVLGRDDLDDVLNASGSIPLSGTRALALVSDIRANAAKLRSAGFLTHTVKGSWTHVVRRLWISDLVEADCESWVMQLGRPPGHVAKLVAGKRLSSLSPKNVWKLEGAPIRVVFVPVRGTVPELKRTPSPKWAPSFLFLNICALAWISYLTFRRVHEKCDSFRFRTAITQLARVLEPGQDVSFFVNPIMGDVERSLLHLSGSHTGQYDLDFLDHSHFYALWHFSVADLRHAMSSKHLLRGIATPGGRVAHVGLHCPEKAQGFNAATKRAASFAEGSVVSRQVQQLPLQLALERAAIVFCELQTLAVVPADGLFSCRTVKEKAEDEQCDAAVHVAELVYERLVLLKGFVAQLPSWTNVPQAQLAVVSLLNGCLSDCSDALTKTRFSSLRPFQKVDAEGEKIAKAQKRSVKLQKLLTTQLSEYQVGEDARFPDFPFEALSADAAVASLLHPSSSLSWGADAGVHEEQFCAIPEEVAFGFYSAAKDFNVASGPVPHAVPPLPPLMDDFRLTQQTSLFKLGDGVFAELSRSKQYEQQRAQHVAAENVRIVSLCTTYRNAPTSCRDVLHQEKRRAGGVAVTESLLRASRKIGGVVCAPHEFVHGGSTVASVHRAFDMLLRAPAVRGAYNVSLYVNAKARQHVAVDRAAQMAIDQIEITQLQYSLNPVVRAMEAVVRDPSLDAKAELLVHKESTSLSAVERAQLHATMESCPDDLAPQRQHLVYCASRVLASLNRNVSLQTAKALKRKIQSLRQKYLRLYANGDLCDYVPPCSLVSFGKWGCFQPNGAHWSSCWPRARFQRVMQQIIVRRAKFKLYCLKQLRQCQGEVPSVVKGGLLMVDIQSKQISEIRSTKQASLLSTLFSGVRLDTRAPPKSLFPTLAVDRPWKLRFFEYEYAGELFRKIIQRDVAASFALAWLSLWERFAFEENLFLELTEQRDERILLRPAAYLYHEDYADWLNGTVKVNKLTRF